VINVDIVDEALPVPPPPRFSPSDVENVDMVEVTSSYVILPLPVPTCPIALEKDEMASYINDENGLLNVEIFVLSEEFKFIRLPKNVDIDDDELPLPPVLNGKAIPLIDDTVKLDVLNVKD
jgi:hypothetical protein